MYKENKVVFLTYGDKKFNLQKKHLVNLTKKSNIIDSSFSMGPKDIDKKFQKKYQDILSNEKGGGFWIWKYYFINKVFNKLDDGDILIYSDAGSTFNYESRKKLENYIESLISSKTGNLRFFSNLPENNWTSKEIFEYFNISPFSSFGISGQYIASTILFQKNINSTNLLDDFNKLLEHAPKLITDDYDDQNQIKEFVENRHDQSIFSILSKLYGCYSVENDETSKHYVNNDFKSYPFLTIRNRMTGWQKFKFYLFYPYFINKPLTFNRQNHWYLKPSIFERINYKIKRD